MHPSARVGLSIVALAIAATIPKASAQWNEKDGTGREWWFFLYNGTAQRPSITGFLTTDRRAHAMIYAQMDIPDPLVPHDPDDFRPNPWRWKLQLGTDNNGHASGFVYGMTDEAAANKQQPIGSISLTSRKEGRRVLCDGVLRIAGTRSSLQSLRKSWLQSHNLWPVPKALRVELIGFTAATMHAMSDVGPEPGYISASWNAAHSIAAPSWLRRRGFRFHKEEGFNDEGKPSNLETDDGRFLFQIDTPGFDENIICWEMLKSGLFEEVLRQGVGLGGTGTYDIIVPTQSVFAHGPEAPNAPSEALRYVRGLVTKLKSIQKYQDVVFEMPVSTRKYRYESKVVGPSQTLRKQKAGYWDKYSLQFFFLRTLGQPENEVTISLEASDGGCTKGPGKTPPPSERFTEPADPNEFLITVGSDFSDLSGALRSNLSE